MVFEKGELKLLWPFYAYYLISGFVVLLSAYMTVYFLDLGFTFFQMMALMMAFALSMLLFEIPTGAIADSFSRKGSVIAGFVIAGIAGLLVPLFTSFWPLFLCMALIGTGVAFMSGAEEAWVIDNLRFHKRRELQKGFLVRSQAVSAVGMFIVPLFGATITGRFGLVSVWYIFGIAFLLCALFLLVAAPEHYRPKRVHWTSALRQSYRSSGKALQYVRRNKFLLPLFMGGVLFMLINAGEDGWQPFLVMQGLPQAWLGYIFAVLGSTGLLAPLLVPQLERFGTRNALRILTALAIIVTGGVFLLTKNGLLASILLFFLIRIIQMLYYPISSDLMHTIVPSKMRATVGSMRNMTGSAATAILLLPLGHAMDLYGPQTIIAVCAFFGIGAWIMLSKLPSA